MNTKQKNQNTTKIFKIIIIQKKKDMMSETIHNIKMMFLRRSGAEISDNQKTRDSRY